MASAVLGRRQGGIAAEVTGPPVTRDYRPTYSGMPAWVSNPGVQIFNLGLVDRMSDDEMISLGTAMIETPIIRHENQYKVIADDPRIEGFIQKTLSRFWKRPIRAALSLIKFGYSAGEALYEVDAEGLLRFSGLKPLKQFDVEAARNKITGTLGGVYVIQGSSQKHVLLGAEGARPAKGLWWHYGNEFNNWYGESRYRGAFDPWLEKNGVDGIKQIIKMWFYKNAYSGLVIRHPEKTVLVNGVQIPARDMARQIAEVLKTGGVAALPSTVNPRTGKVEWEIEWPHMNGSADGLLEYLQHLDEAELRGMKIPDNVVTGASAGAGVKVPEDAFYTMEEDVLHAIVVPFEEGVIRPLVEYNYGPGHKYEILWGPMLPARQQLDAQAQAGAGAPGRGNPLAQAGTPTTDFIRDQIAAQQPQAPQEVPAGGVQMALKPDGKATNDSDGKPADSDTPQEVTAKSNESYSFAPHPADPEKFAIFRQGAMATDKMFGSKKEAELHARGLSDAEAAARKAAADAEVQAQKAAGKKPRKPKEEKVAEPEAKALPPIKAEQPKAAKHPGDDEKWKYDLTGYDLKDIRPYLVKKAQGQPLAPREASAYESYVNHVAERLAKQSGEKAKSLIEKLGRSQATTDEAKQAKALIEKYKDKAHDELMTILGIEPPEAPTEAAAPPPPAEKPAASEPAEVAAPEPVAPPPAPKPVAAKQPKTPRQPKAPKSDLPKIPKSLAAKRFVQFFTTYQGDSPEAKALSGQLIQKAVDEGKVEKVREEFNKAARRGEQINQGVLDELNRLVGVVPGQPPVAPEPAPEPVSEAAPAPEPEKPAAEVPLKAEEPATPLAAKPRGKKAAAKPKAEDKWSQPFRDKIGRLDAAKAYEFLSGLKPKAAKDALATLNAFDLADLVSHMDEAYDAKKDVVPALYHEANKAFDKEAADETKYPDEDIFENEFLKGRPQDFEQKFDENGPTYKDNRDAVKAWSENIDKRLDGMTEEALYGLEERLTAEKGNPTNPFLRRKVEEAIDRKLEAQVKAEEGEGASEEKAEPAAEATPEQKKPGVDDVMSELQRLRKEKYSQHGMVPIDELRTAMAEKFGEANATPEVLNPLFQKIRVDRKAQPVAIGDYSQFTKDQLNNLWDPGNGETYASFDVPEEQGQEPEAQPEPAQEPVPESVPESARTPEESAPPQAESPGAGQPPAEPPQAPPAAPEPAPEPEKQPEVAVPQVEPSKLPGSETGSPLPFPELPLFPPVESPQVAGAVGSKTTPTVHPTKPPGTPPPWFLRPVPTIGTQESTASQQMPEEPNKPSLPPLPGGKALDKDEWIPGITNAEVRQRMATVRGTPAGQKLSPEAQKANEDFQKKVFRVAAKEVLSRDEIKRFVELQKKGHNMDPSETDAWAELYQKVHDRQSEIMGKIEQGAGGVAAGPPKPDLPDEPPIEGEEVVEAEQVPTVSGEEGKKALKGKALVAFDAMDKWEPSVEAPFPSAAGSGTVVDDLAAVLRGKNAGAVVTPEEMAEHRDTLLPMARLMKKADPEFGLHEINNKATGDRYYVFGSKKTADILKSLEEGVADGSFKKNPGDNPDEVLIAGAWKTLYGNAGSEAAMQAARAAASQKAYAKGNAQSVAQAAQGAAKANPGQAKQVQVKVDEGVGKAKKEMSKLEFTLALVRLFGSLYFMRHMTKSPLGMLILGALAYKAIGTKTPDELEEVPEFAGTAVPSGVGSVQAMTRANKNAAKVMNSVFGAMGQKVRVTPQDIDGPPQPGVSVPPPKPVATLVPQPPRPKPAVAVPASSPSPPTAFPATSKPVAYPIGVEPQLSRLDQARVRDAWKAFTQNREEFNKLPQEDRMFFFDYMKNLTQYLADINLTPQEKFTYKAYQAGVSKGQQISDYLRDTGREIEKRIIHARQEYMRNLVANKVAQQVRTPTPKPKANPAP